DEQSLVFDKIPGGCLGFQAVVVTVGDTAGAADDTLHKELIVPVTPKTVVFNEIMAAPAEDDPEWIEVVNTADVPVDMYGWRIRDAAGTVSGTIDCHGYIGPDGYAVISKLPVGNVASDSPAFNVAPFPQLNNDGDTITLLDCSEAVMDSTVYGDAPSGISLECISPRQSGDRSAWDRCVAPGGSTPGTRNSIYYSSNPGEEGSTVLSPVLRIEPNPFADMVTLSYELPCPLARVRLIVYDRRGRLVASIRDTEESGSVWSGVWDGRSGGSRLTAGPYILDFEALDKRTGKLYRLRKTIVVASRL
ncbi:lamin tail domain-containing protein, partial [bacterium]|nr:lamin tail domain-containing protein [bacterium]